MARSEEQQQQELGRKDQELKETTDKYQGQLNSLQKKIVDLVSDDLDKTETLKVRVSEDD